MSRYSIGNDIIVGWDNPLQTFFYQIWEEDDMVCGGGNWDKEIPTLEKLQEELALIDVEIPQNVLDDLIYDYGIREEPINLQKAVTKFFTGLKS